MWDWVCPLKLGRCCSGLESGLVADFGVVGLLPAWSLHYPHPAHIDGSSHHWLGSVLVSTATAVGFTDSVVPIAVEAIGAPHVDVALVGDVADGKFGRLG